jgi:hypothetical protein
MNPSKAKQLVGEARKIARQADSWVVLSNALTDPNGGLIARYFPDLEQRREFLRSDEYEQLNRLLLLMIEQKGISPRPAGGTNTPAG